MDRVYPRPRYDTCLPADMVEEEHAQIDVQIYNQVLWGEHEYIRRAVTVEEFLDLADDRDEAWQTLCRVLDTNLTVDEWEEDYLYVYWGGPGLAEAMSVYWNSH